MSKELDKHRIQAETRQPVFGLEGVVTLKTLPCVTEELQSVIIDYNFDTFSFLFELQDIKAKSDISYSEAARSLKIDSISMAQKYHGTNCSGMSALLQNRLNKSGITTFLSPSYGSYLLTENADRYSEIRTIDLLGMFQEDSGKITPLFLAPGLTVDKPMLVIPGYNVESFGNLFTILEVDEEKFVVESLKPGSEPIRRTFMFLDVANIDESLQKNLLRTRTRYQITRQNVQGKRDFVTFDFPQRIFRLDILGRLRSLMPNEFYQYLKSDGDELDLVFNNPHLKLGLEWFSQNYGQVGNDLLLPSIKNILEEIWKSS